MAILTAKTNKGIVRGVPGNDPRTTVFRGIPFAKPPIGDLRFQPPQEAEPWEGELKCDKFRAACLQYERRQPMGILGVRPRSEADEIPQSEDCLYLNVFTPANSADERLPVLCWIYGGGFNTGSSFHPTYDGEAFNRKGCILVTIAYRCNVMGFLALKGMTTGNMGLLDQVMALKWIQENIEAFGGDKDNVTIFGQSAGGISTKYHLVSDMSRGLFKRAVIHSGGGLNAADPTRPREELEEISQKCLDFLGWTAEDLMSRDASEVCISMGDAAEQIMKGTNELFVFQPCVDGTFFTELPEKSLKDGKMADADVICSTVTGDHWMFSRKVRHLLADRPDILHAFAYSPSQSLARNQVRIGGKPIRTCFFERRVPGDDRGSPHGCELQYMFGTVGRYNRPWEPYDLELSYMMTEYWANFAKTGDPNGAGLPNWPLYTEAEPLTLHITNDGVCAENLVESADADHVIEFTIAHPGMLETLEEF